MRYGVTFALFLSAALCAHAERPPMHGAHRRDAETRQQQTKEQAKANEESKRKIAHYKTDEGVCGEDDDLIPVARVKAYADALCAKRPKAMRVEVLPKTGHAESEKAAYAKQDAWKWLLR